MSDYPRKRQNPRRRSASRIDAESGVSKSAVRPSSAGPTRRQQAAGSSRARSGERISAQSQRREQAPSVQVGVLAAPVAPTLSRFLPILAVGAVLIAAIAFGVSRGAPEAELGAVAPSTASSAAVDTALARVSFAAVGDNVPNDVLGEYADASAGSPGDGSYDYRPLFSAIKTRISSADLAYIDQETHIGGDDIGPAGYPSFNTTDEMADAVVDAGFDFVASATNHAYDWGYYGAVEHSRSVWNEQPVAFTGTATSWEEAEEIATLERDGITFALLSYTYGINGFEPGDIEGYYVNLIDEDRILSDVERAKSQADVVIAAMHWGTEDDSNPDDLELTYAQLLADAGVDVVLGSHPHIIQPMTWLQGSQGTKTLVCYSLGNFIMQYENQMPYKVLGGMLTCDFVRHQQGGEVEIENIEWVPLVYHGVEGEYSVWPVSEYPEAFAKRNEAFADMNDPKAWMLKETSSIVNRYGDSFAVEGVGSSQVSSTISSVE